MQGWISLGVAGTMLVAGVFLVCAPPWSRVASWLVGETGSADEAAVTAVHAGMQRSGVISGISAVVLGVAAVVGDFDLYAALLGFALAVVIGAGAPLGGSRFRRAVLSGNPGAGMPGGPRGAVGLRIGVVNLVLAVALSLVLDARTPGPGTRAVEASWWMPQVDLRQLAVIGAGSLLLSVTAVATRRMVRARQSMAGAPAVVDAAVRRLAWHRIASTGTGGQLILLGVLLPGLQILALPSGPQVAMEGPLMAVTSVLGGALVLAGAVVLLLSVLMPVWIQPRRTADHSADSATGQAPAAVSDAVRGASGAGEQPTHG